MAQGAVVSASKAAAIIRLLSDKANRDPRFLAAVVARIER